MRTKRSQLLLPVVSVSASILSCQSQPFDRSLILNTSHAAKEPFYSWHMQCLDKTRGNVDLLLTTTSNLQFTLTGQWSQNFTELKGSLNNQIGQEVAEILLSHNTYQFTLSSDIRKLAVAKELQMLLTPLFSLGAMGLRRTFCGIIGFSETNTTSLATKPALPNEHLYTSVLAGACPKGQKNCSETTLELLSLYTLQSNEAKINVHFRPQDKTVNQPFDFEWNGSFSPLAPTKFKLTQGKTSIQFKVNDFS